MKVRDLQALRFDFAHAPGVGHVLVDCSVAVLCAALALASLAGRIRPMTMDDGNPAPFLPEDLLGISLVLLSAGALLLRRRRPMAILAVVGISSFLVGALGYTPPPLPAAELVIVYTVASTLPAVVSTWAALVIAVSIVAADRIHEAVLNDDKLLAYLLAVVGAWVLGYFLRVSRTQAAIAQENIALLTQHEQARTQMAVRQEQERISRELHDVVAHSVGVMVAQASAARLVFWKQPEFAYGALGSVEGTGRAALAELRVLLRVLHADEADGSGPTAGSTLAGLPLLVERVKAAGLPVELLTRGTARPLPHSVDMAAYRIVQESLTNCLKHAGSAQATVRIDYGGDWLQLQISDNGVKTPTGDPGRGLIGMQQRAILLGGALTAVRLATGFQVRATLPLSESRS